MTHVENIPHIIQYGVTHKNSVNANNKYVPIGDSSLISNRDAHIIFDKKIIGDFIPFYFGKMTPMLFVIQKGFNGVEVVHPSKIVYVTISIKRLLDSKSEFIYTDGHATEGYTNVYIRDQITDIANQLDFKAIKSKYWRDENDLDLKRRKEAELLLENDLSYEYINGFVVYDNECKNNLIRFGVEEKKIHIDTNYYF